MFYGGPKEAVMHAIYRQNFGFTDIIIGRKHADAPYHDGTPIWGDFDAQEIFDHLAGDLKIRPLRVGFAAFYQSLGRVDLMDNHTDEKPVFISGKEVRKCLLEGRPVDPRIMRANHRRDPRRRDGREIVFCRALKASPPGLSRRNEGLAELQDPRCSPTSPPGLSRRYEGLWPLRLRLRGRFPILPSAGTSPGEGEVWE